MKSRFDVNVSGISHRIRQRCPLRNVSTLRCVDTKAEEILSRLRSSQ
jgi:hypothetical protein